MPKTDGGMGFKNRSAFNYAMLSKQAWSFMTKPHNLVTRLYKAKYFPKCDFLDSVIAHNPSYVWRSIWNLWCDEGINGVFGILEFGGKSGYMITLY